MFGILFIGLGSLLNEIGSSIGKKAAMEKRESVLGMAFVNALIGTLLVVLLIGVAPLIPLLANTGLFTYSFSLQSLPTFLIRAFLEIINITIFSYAAVASSRASFAFLRVLTIPFLLVIDFFLGYTISLTSLIGIAIIILVTGVMVSKHVLDKKGVYLTLASALLAVVVISLYKYNITHFNSVPAEQMNISIIFLVYLYLITRFTTKESPLRHLKRPQALAQSVVVGIGSIFISFAFLFTTSAIATTALRASSILWAIVAGVVYFQEIHFRQKIFGFFGLVVGLILLSNPF